MTRYPKTGKGTRWTAKELTSIQPKWTGDTLSDGEGLSGEVRVDVGDGVSVRWKYAYRWEGKVRWFQCGTFPDHSMADIRAKRDFAREQVAGGVNPIEKHQAQKIENRIAVEKVLIDEELRQRQSLTVSDLFESWLTDGVARKDGNANLRRSFEKDVLPAIGETPIKKLSEQDLRKLYRDVVERGVERTAVILANDIRQMMRWAEERQPWRGLLIDGNPAKLVDVKKLLPHDYTEERDRVLSTEEIRELRDRFESMEREYAESESKYSVERPLTVSAQCAVWLCLSTLCRIGELLMTEWRHVDLDSGEWFIPAENTKSHRGKNQDQTIFLSKFSLTQFQRLRDISRDSRWVFPAKHNEGHVSVKAVSKQVGDRQTMFRDRKDLANRINSNALVLSEGMNGAWTPHDLRRTGATMMQSMAIPLEIIDRCQNHILAGSRVRRHYMKYEYAQEKRDAWAKLGERIEQILSADNLVELRGVA